MAELDEVRQTARRVAHDLNNLLGVISNYAHFVHDEATLAASGDVARPWAAVVSDIDQIRVAAERAAVLTDELLAVAHVDDELLADRALTYPTG